MQHLQPFALFEARASGTLTQEQEDFLNRYTQGTWSVNPATGLVDVKGSFKCLNVRLQSLVGIKFGTVTEGFRCDYNQLTDLVGAPKTVGESFWCSNNLLTSLEGAPQTVAGSFDCEHNQLISLAGAPQTVARDFNCNYNPLTSLTGAPKTVGENFYCNFNQLTSLVGAPQTVGGNFYCIFNPLTGLVGAPQTVKGAFFCDEFQLSHGQWNPKGWLQVLREGNPAARRLVLTLPDFGAQFWLNRLKGDLKQDGQTLLQLADLWQSPGWEEEQARLQQELDPGQLRAIQALRTKLIYVNPWQDFKL